MQNLPTLLDETAKLLRDRHSHIRLKDIAGACDVSIAWLSKLQTGKLTDSLISKIDRVNSWLKAHKNV